MPVTKPSPDAGPAEEWGPFVLGRRIGRGGMGSVRAALRRGTFGIAQLVAVKTMTSGIAEDPAAREGFLREARILARLAHPNVVRWLDAGEVGDDVFIAMELLHGASLAQILAASEGPPPLPVALAILLDLARGLHAAHELCDEAGEPLGLVHQDVSPQNAVVGYDGRTRLVDFGVARLASVDASRTDTVRGKPAYLAPEQLEGRRLDRRTDVFALGVVAFEVLTGCRLFARASIAETHTAVLFDPVPDLRAMREGVPSAVAAAVRRALARSRDERWPTADAFRRALVLARDEAGIPNADDPEIGAFARACVPPVWTPEQLFAEIEGAVEPEPAAVPPTEEISQAVTVAPRRAASVLVSAAPGGAEVEQGTTGAQACVPEQGIGGPEQGVTGAPDASSIPAAGPPRTGWSGAYGAPGQPSSNPALAPPGLPGRAAPPGQAGAAPHAPRRRGVPWRWIGLTGLAAVLAASLARAPRLSNGHSDPDAPAGALARGAAASGTAALAEADPAGGAPLAVEPSAHVEPSGSAGAAATDPTNGRPARELHPGGSGAGGALDVPRSAASAPPSGPAPRSSQSALEGPAAALPATSSAAPGSAAAGTGAPAAAPAPASGWISVWSTPWGRVRIDGRAVGDSPAVRIVVPPGPHTVSVRSDAGEQSKSVSVKVGEESKVRFVF